MTRDDKYEHARFVIDRFDHYNDSVNNKGAFYIGLNTFLLGGLFAGFASLYKDIELTRCLWSLLIGFGLCSILSSILTVIAINPFLTSGNKDSKKRSLIFFGSVAEYEKDNYVEAFMQQDEDRKIYDTVNQSWFLAKGLTGKYQKLKWAGWLIIIQFLLLVPIIYSITKSLLQ